MKSNRRKFFATIGTGAAGLTLGPTFSSSAAGQGQKRGPAVDADGPVLLVGDKIAVAETTCGKVRGFTLRGIHHFLGLPYGADTAGANRFMPPQKPKPWTDVYPALWWGNSAPQNMDNRYANKYASWRDHWNYDDVSEDCLRLNVFTPAINDGRKRPVLFWIHGGGYTNGNGIEHDGYNGENLARFGDIVFVSINHRLGPLGYCNLAGVGGEKFAAPDLAYFDAIVPCGIREFGVTSIARIAGRAPAMAEVMTAVVAALADVFGRELAQDEGAKL